MESKIACLVSADLGDKLAGFGAELVAGGGMPIIVGWR